MLYFCPYYGNADSLLFVFKYANSQTVRPSTNDHLVFIKKVFICAVYAFCWSFAVFLCICCKNSQIWIAREQWNRQHNVNLQAYISKGQPQKYKTTEECNFIYFYGSAEDTKFFFCSKEWIPHSELKSPRFRSTISSGCLAALLIFTAQAKNLYIVKASNISKGSSN